MLLIQTQKERKMLITYYKTYGISTLKKHVDNDHAIIVKKIEEEINVIKRGPIEKQQKKKIVSRNVISKFFLSKILLKRMMNSKNTFCKTLVF